MVYPCQAAAWIGTKNRIRTGGLEKKDDKRPDHHGRKAHRNLSKAIRLHRSIFAQQRGFTLWPECSKASAINGKTVDSLKFLTRRFQLSLALRQFWCERPCPRWQARRKRRRRPSRPFVGGQNREWEEETGNRQADKFAWREGRRTTGFPRVTYLCDMTRKSKPINIEHP